MPQDVCFNDLKFIIEFVYRGEIDVSQAELQVREISIYRDKNVARRCPYDVRTGLNGIPRPFPMIQIVRRSEVNRYRYASYSSEEQDCAWSSLKYIREVKRIVAIVTIRSRLSPRRALFCDRVADLVDTLLPTVDIHRSPGYAISYVSVGRQPFPFLSIYSCLFYHLTFSHFLLYRSMNPSSVLQSHSTFEMAP